MIVGLTVLRQLLRFIPTKIHKTVVTRAAPFGSDMHQIVCWLGLRPRPHWGILQRSPKSPSWIKGPTSKGRGRVLLLSGGEGRKGEREGRKRMAGPIPNPLLLVCFHCHYLSALEALCKCALYKSTFKFTLCFWLSVNIAKFSESFIYCQFL